MRVILCVHVSPNHCGCDSFKEAANWQCSTLKRARLVRTNHRTEMERSQVWAVNTKVGMSLVYRHRCHFYLHLHSSSSLILHTLIISINSLVPTYQIPSLIPLFPLSFNSFFQGAYTGILCCNNPSHIHLTVSEAITIPHQN